MRTNSIWWAINDSRISSGCMLFLDGEAKFLGEPGGAGAGAEALLGRHFEARIQQPQIDPILRGGAGLGKIPAGRNATAVGAQWFFVCGHLNPPFGSGGNRRSTPALLLRRPRIFHGTRGRVPTGMCHQDGRAPKTQPPRLARRGHKVFYAQEFSRPVRLS